MNVVEQVLNKFLTNFKFECTAKYMEDSDSYYDDAEEVIILGGMSDLTADMYFMNLCKERGLKAEVNVDTMSFLHELGHYETMFLLDDEDWKKSYLIKAVAEVKQDYMMYFKCPVEIIATDWAINFANEYQYAVENFSEKLLDSILSIC